MPKLALFQTAADVLAKATDEIRQGLVPRLFQIGRGSLEQVEIGPGLVTLIGGAPGAGKTAFTMQAIVDALRFDTSLKAVACNIEMAPTALIDRQLARLSGIDSRIIRYRQIQPEHVERLNDAISTFESVGERLAFVRPPFDLENVAATADEFHANLILLDYIQRIPPPGSFGDKRSSVDATMNYLRQFADAGMAVIVVAAVGRTKDSKGRSSYSGDGLGLASFRESSELEFGADDAFLLVPDPEVDGQVILRHLKARHGEQRDIALQFHGACQRFDPVSAQVAAAAARPSLSAALSAQWRAANPAEEDDSEEKSE